MRARVPKGVQGKGLNKDRRKQKNSLSFSLSLPLFYFLLSSPSDHRRRRGSVLRGRLHRRGRGEGRLLLGGLLLLLLGLLLLRGHRLLLLLRRLLRALANVVVLGRRGEGAALDRDEVVEFGRAELVLEKFWFNEKNESKK